MNVFSFKRENLSISKLLVIPILIIGIASFFNLFAISDLLAINPANILNRMEFWRLFSFPFVPKSIESFVLSIFVLWLLAPKIEKLYKPAAFLPMLILLALIESCAQSLIFWKQNIMISGADSISIFILTLFLALTPNSKISVLKKPVKTIAITLLVALVYICSTLINSFNNSPEQALATSVSIFIGGLIGLIAFFQIRHYQYKEIFKHTAAIYRELKKQETINLQNEKRYAYASKTKVENGYDTKMEEEFVFDEDELNKVLDKISESGITSLSENEKKYLKEYSEKLKSDK